MLQLINAGERDSERITHFDARIHPVVESLTLLATVALKADLPEERLMAQIEQLRIQVDEARKARQVSEIVESDCFQGLKSRAGELKGRYKSADNPKDVKS